MNRLALGTAQFGMKYGIANKSGQVTQNEASTIIKASFARGFDTIDTAMSYGESEQLLGQIGIDNWRIVSKLPVVPTDCNDVSSWASVLVDESLRRLNTAKLYGLLLHRPQQLLESKGDKVYSALESLKRDGRVQNIGISIYNPLELRGIFDRYKIDLVQAPFNVLDRRLIETGWLQKLFEQGTELHVRSVFLQGLLLMKPDDRPLKFGRWSHIWNKWDEWLAYSGLTPLEACLRHAMSYKQISKVIVGLDSLNQLHEISLASVGPMLESPEELGTLDTNLINPYNW